MIRSGMPQDLITGDMQTLASLLVSRTPKMVTDSKETAEPMAFEAEEPLEATGLPSWLSSQAPRLYTSHVLGAALACLTRLLGL
jgi:hypothetical protein